MKIRETEPVQSEMTRQDVFNIVARHLLEQGKHSLIDIGETQKKCAYHGCDGSKCAIGVLIPDEVYSENLEYLGVGTHTLRKCLQNAQVPTESEGMMFLLQHLQSAHDNYNAKSWPKALQIVALGSDLDYSIVHTVLNELGYNAETYDEYTKAKGADEEFIDV